MADPVPTSGAPSSEVAEWLITYTMVIYVLQALSVGITVYASMSDGGVFIEGLPFVAAVVMSYVQRSAVRGTFLESHFRWQIRTFWFGLLFGIIVGAVSFLLLFAGVSLYFIALLALGVWLIYRVIRGWFALKDRRPVQ